MHVANAPVINPGHSIITVPQWWCGSVPADLESRRASSGPLTVDLSFKDLRYPGHQSGAHCRTSSRAALTTNLPPQYGSPLLLTPCSLSPLVPLSLPPPSPPPHSPLTLSLSIAPLSLPSPLTPSLSHPPSHSLPSHSLPSPSPHLLRTFLAGLSLSRLISCS